MWLDGLNTAVLEFIDNVTSTLEIEKKYGLIVPEYTSKEEVEVDEEEVEA
jgi:hypothetical protein